MCCSPSRRDAAPTSDSTFGTVAANASQSEQRLSKALTPVPSNAIFRKQYGVSWGHIVPDVGDAIYRVPTVDVSLSFVPVE